MRTDPSAPLRLAVVAPGGYGKTTLLRELERTYRAAGVEVVTDWPTTGVDDWRRAVMLVDDAHLLPGGQLRMLREIACSRLVVACRPWPLSPELAELVQDLDRGHLSAWDLSDVRLLCPSADPDAVYSLSWGVPRWVVRLADTGGRVTPAVVESVRYELESLDPDVIRYLVAARCGLGSRIDLLGDLLPATAVEEVMRAARATGFVAADGSLMPLCASVVSRVVVAEQYLGVLQRLAELLSNRPEPILPFARSLLGSGATGSTVAAVLTAAAHEAVPADPAMAAELFGAAVTAGQPSASVIIDWARATALSGDLDTALRLADRAILEKNRAGASIAGCALAHRGHWARSAQLFGWSSDSAFAQIASIAVGSPGTVPSSRSDRPPTSMDGAAALMAEGVRQSVSDSPATALSTLIQASALLAPAGADALLPDSPAALAALVALHSGEPDIAESVVDSALAGRMGGDVLRARHQLLLAWIRMVRGQLGDAAHLMSDLVVREPRDQLFFAGLETGLARRCGDVAALRRAWTRASSCLVSHPVDLFTFLPLAELTVAATRLRAPARPLLRDAFTLLSKLGNPPLWAAPLHWAGIQAAILSEDLPAAAPHITALAAQPTAYGAALAQAAQCWVRVHLGDFSPSAVMEAAKALHAVGHWWDSARLASETALRTSDRKAMVSLLEYARQQQPLPRRATAPPASPLSDREQEVASLVIQGMTYKQIGDKLFISAKTVEHHMARIRHRLGASNRSELLSQLRALSNPAGQ